METKRKIGSLGFLRGLAVTMVCFCHFGNALLKDTHLFGVFNAFHSYGVYGVQIFFVVSGFIIPLSMDKAEYQIKYYFKFLAKRAVRLHPPYLVALALTLVIVFVANHVKHIPFPETTLSIIKSCFYKHLPADNPVFWTLRVEAQYYIFMGLYFALLKNYPRLALYITIPVLMILSQTIVADHIELLKYLVFFLIGTVGYMIYNKNESSNKLEYALLVAIVAFAFIYYEWAGALAAAASIAFILFYHRPINKIFDYIGEISYSIYLIHFPIGIKLINFASAHIKPNYYWTLFLLANVVVFIMAAIFWKFIEKPSGDFSNNIKYGKAKNVPTPIPVAS